MDETFIVDLPTEANNTRFNVYAPQGGLRDALQALLEGTSEVRFLDLDVRHGFTYGMLRIYPGENISQDGRRPHRFYVSDGVAVFLDELGVEHGDNLSFGGYLETEAVHAGSVTGELTLWRQPFPKFNAAS